MEDVPRTTIAGRRWSVVASHPCRGDVCMPARRMEVQAKEIHDDWNTTGCYCRPAAKPPATCSLSVLCRVGTLHDAGGLLTTA